MSNLLSRLRGENLNEIAAINQHVMQLLNSHQGSVQHMPNYGIKPFVGTHAGKEHRQSYYRHVAEQIMAYEPRIRHALVEEAPVNQPDTCMQLCITFVLSDGRSHQVRACLRGNGKVDMDEAVN